MINESGRSTTLHYFYSSMAAVNNGSLITWYVVTAIPGGRSYTTAFHLVPGDRAHQRRRLPRG